MIECLKVARQVLPLSRSHIIKTKAESETIRGSCGKLKKIKIRIHSFNSVNSIIYAPAKNYYKATQRIDLTILY